MPSSVHLQFRHVFNWRDADDDTDSGFEIRRARFSLNDTALSPRLKYDVTWSADRGGGAVTLLDAAVEYEFAEAWSVELGQFKAPVAHEEVTSSRRQLAVDRSLVNDTLGLGRVQGVAIRYGNGKTPLRAAAMYHDGAGSINTDFRDPPANDTYWGAAARVEYKLSGDWRLQGLHRPRDRAWPCSSQNCARVLSRANRDLPLSLKMPIIAGGSGTVRWSGGSRRGGWRKRGGWRTGRRRRRGRWPISQRCSAYRSSTGTRSAA